MPEFPRICVVVPVFNHGLTVGGVVREAQRFFPVIAVDDGSRDRTAAALAEVAGVRVLTLQENRGKAAALRAGFALAEETGFSHAVTMDADGQHPVEALADFGAACRRDPEAFIIGVRDLKAACAPWERRLSNALSSFWFTLETGLRLRDTQCGFRVYPLAAIGALRVKADRYAYELEVMAKAAWAGIRLAPLPVGVDYAAPTSRLSHFHPLRDFARISRAHARLLGRVIWDGLGARAKG